MSFLPKGKEGEGGETASELAKLRVGGGPFVLRPRTTTTLKEEEGASKQKGGRKEALTRFLRSSSSKAFSRVPRSREPNIAPPPPRRGKKGAVHIRLPPMLMLLRAQTP